MELNNQAIESVKFIEDRPIVVGLNPSGEFIVKFGKHGFLKITENELVPMLPLLELDFDFFTLAIESLVSKYNKKGNFPQISSSKFPLENLIKTALGSERDFWIELSIPWLINIDPSKFKSEIDEIVMNKKISQKTRHKMLKLL